MIFHAVVWPKLLLITKTCKTYHWPLRAQDEQKISRWLCFSRLRILQAKRFRKVIPKGQQSEDSNTTTTGVTLFNNKKDTDEEVEESGNESDDTPPSHADVGHDSDAEVSCPWVVWVNWPGGWSGREDLGTEGLRTVVSCEVLSSSLCPNVGYFSESLLMAVDQLGTNSDRTILFVAVGQRVSRIILIHPDKQINLMGDSLLL